MPSYKRTHLLQLKAFIYVDVCAHVTFGVVEEQEWHVVLLLWLTPRLHHTVLLIFFCIYAPCLCP